MTEEKTHCPRRHAKYDNPEPTPAVSDVIMRVILRYADKAVGG